ncbi:MAG: leucine-rich repeat domain-containing protein [Thermoplasmata archaeon]|nr:leucine-rich repeat domain-containing protein [Thermoplasmata archaeon]
MYTTTENENVEKNHRPIRIAVVCAAVMMVVALVPLFADGLIAEETVEEGNDGDVHWVISGDTMTITPKEGKDKADMDDYDDAGEEPNWRKAAGWPNVKNLEIKDGVTCVGKRAFAWVDDEEGAKLETVTFDGSVKKIKECAFINQYIQTINFSEGLEEIGPTAFGYCSPASLTLPASLKEIGDNGFFLSGALHDLVLPETLEYVGWESFGGIGSLKKLTISCKEVGGEAFAMVGPEYLEISSNVKKIGENAFTCIFVVDGQEHDFNDLDIDQLRGTVWTGNGDYYLYLQNSAGDQSNDNLLLYVAIGVCAVIAIAAIAYYLHKKQQSSV